MIINIKKYLLLISCAAILLLSCKANKKTTSAATPANKGVEQTAAINPDDGKYKYNTNTIIKTDNLTVDEFNTITASSKLVIVDFNAVWCGPCRRLTPILNELEKEYGDKIKVVKIDVDKNKDLANHFVIMSIPFVRMFKDGVLMEQWEGLPSKANLKYWIDKLLK